MAESPRFQVYATYRDSPDGCRRWLPIGFSEVERIIARRQLRDGGKFDIRIRNGRPQGAVRMRRRGY